MTPLQVLEAAEVTLKAGLVRTDVLVGGVLTTPTQPYVVLSASTAYPSRMLSGDPEHDTVTLHLRAVNNSLPGCLTLAQRCRVILDGLILDRGPLMFDFSPAPLEDDEPGSYRWSSVAEYVAHVDP